MSNIVVIGSANMDTTCYIKNFPEEITSESLNSVSEMKRVLGGKGANQAVSASLQSQGTQNKIFFIGCVGNDESGEKIIESFQEKGIDYSGVKKIDDSKTDGRIILVDETGENRMIGYGDCVKQLSPEMLQEENIKAIIDNADIVMIQMKMPNETVEYVIKYCKDNNKMLLIDPTPVEKSSLLIEKGLMNYANYMTPNEEEAYALAMYELGLSIEQINESMSKINREKRIKIIEDLVKRHPNIIATMGDVGVIYNKEGEVKSKKPYPTECIDSTGAGDTFNGAFISSIARGEDLEKAIDYALMDCANKVKFKGAQNGMQTFEETKRDLENVKNNDENDDNGER